MSRDKTERVKFTTTLNPETIRKLGVMSANIKGDKNDVIEILVESVDEIKWGRQNEVEKTRRDN